MLHMSNLLKAPFLNTKNFKGLWQGTYFSLLLLISETSYLRFGIRELLRLVCAICQACIQSVYCVSFVVNLDTFILAQLVLVNALLQQHNDLLNQLALSGQAWLFRGFLFRDVKVGVVFKPVMSFIVFKTLICFCCSCLKDFTRWLIMLRYCRYQLPLFLYITKWNVERKKKRKQ